MPALKPGAEYEALAGRWERLLDSRPAAFDLRALLADAQSLLVDGGTERAARVKTRTPWRGVFAGLKAGGGAGLAALDAAERFPQERYGWLRTAAGFAHLRHHNFAEAAARLEAGLAFTPRDWKARFFLAEALLCLGRPGDAARALEGAEEEAPRLERGPVLAWRGKIALWLGRYADARRDLDAARATGFIGGLVWQGAAAHMSGESPRALEILDEALRSAPCPEAWIWRGEIKRVMGRPKEALDDLAREPSLTWAAVNEALAKADLGDGDGLEAGFWTVPTFVTAHLRSLLRVPETRVLRPPEMKKLLLKGLALARGFRGDDYDQAVWLPAGAQPRVRLNEPFTAQLVL